MVASDRKLGRLHYSTGYSSSPILIEKTTTIFEIKKEKRRFSLDTETNSKVIKEIEKRLTNAYKELRQAQNHSDELRKNHNEDLAVKRAQQWNTTKVQAAIIIAVSEESKKLMVNIDNTSNHEKVEILDTCWFHHQLLNGAHPIMI